MEIIEGFRKARARLSRLPAAEFGDVSPKIKKRLKAMFGTESPEQVVAQIVRDVRQHGDDAIIHYTLKIDGVMPATLVGPASLEVSKKEIVSARRQVDKELVSALKLAGERIHAFHQAQMDNIKGVSSKEWAQLVRPLERVGVYAPGGTASYPSTVLMTAIPAKVAGVKDVVLATPPKSDGSVPAATLIAAEIAGVDRIFKMGGAQAIAGLAYGTQSIPKVDKICGPGNIFVTLAKKLVFGAVGIDGLQGPSEVMLIADDSADPVYCAADILAQAEHDALSQAILVTTSLELALKIQEELESQLKALPRQAIAGESLENRGVIAVVKDIDEAVELANLYAPEHLQLMVKKPETYLDKIRHAGCVFLGKYSPVAVGDYVAGPNHALPTGGTARFSSPLNVLDFIKFIDVVKIDRTGLNKLAGVAITIARAEGLEAHARAVEKRIKKK